MFFCLIYTNYYQKWQARVRKLIILLDKFRRRIFGGGKMIFQEEKEREKGVLVSIYFKMRKQDLILIINLGIYL